MAKINNVVLILLNSLPIPPLRPELRRISIRSFQRQKLANKRRQTASQIQHSPEQVKSKGLTVLELRVQQIRSVLMPT